MARSLLISIPIVILATGVASVAQAPKDFIAVVPNNLKWTANPTVPGSEYAILLGNPTQSGPLIVRVRMPTNVRIAAHTHPDSRTYTVLSGEWQLGFGNTFDAAALRSFPAGSVYRLPSRVPHFQASGAAGAVVQIESIGPTSTDFIGK